ncbi:hypothetical protein LSH36_777g02119 [Paralvinella palmiformis]|uniref:CULT domain-containing protein n=1 Tax=Paralvinella palmiformis TaxID=53620 RepID=A0AAD9J038_9ANNE|nr:hypothetical protein LSH36_777g02119 [Paralvinella palmiformis]
MALRYQSQQAFRSALVLEYLLCRQCGHEVTKADDLLRVTSVKSIGQRNATILGQKGVLIQRFENPQGRKFEVITTKNVDILNAGEVF